MANTYDIIHSWYEESESGGLPPITEEDEGKVLTVNDGEAVWNDAKTEIFIVHSHEGDSEIVIVESWNEISNANSEGKFIPVYLVGDATGQRELGGFVGSVYSIDDESDNANGYYVDVYTCGSDSPLTFYCETENGNPSTEVQ